MKILKQTMSDIEYLKKNCRNEKIKDALEKTIKLSGNKREPAIRFLERKL